MTKPGYRQFVRLFQRADWMDDAACKGKPADWWHPPRGGNSDTERAKTICGACPVRQTCLQWALDNGEDRGIWGGVSIDNYRRRTSRQRGSQRVTNPRGAPIEHGTYAGYRTHERRGVPPCEDCREAHREYRRQARAEGMIA